MPIRHAKAIPWSPKGCVDAVDGTASIKGGMALLQNLVPDPTTDNMFVPRAAASRFFDFGSLAAPSKWGAFLWGAANWGGGILVAPGFISCLYVTGGYAYGMIAETGGSLAGKDIPFAYDLATNSFITVSGYNASNLPASPPASGAWLPPVMFTVGTNVMLAHAGFDGVTNFIGWLDISTPSAPAWHAGNTSTNVLPGIPVWGANFNNRAYYMIGNQAWYSDVLVPTSMTNAGQAVTCGDASPIVAAGGAQFISSSVGGTIGALIIFKNTIIFQLTGDAAITGSLQLSAVPTGVGTYSALSLCPTPEGLAFMAPDGMRVLNILGTVTPPIGDHGEGVTVPFINTLYPSRICAAFNANTIRISTVNPAPLQGTSANQEWWYNVVRKIWTGPHTFPASLIQPWMTTFIMAPLSVQASLWQSDAYPASTDNFTENGTVLNFNSRTVLLPDTQQMSLNALVETTIGIDWGNASVNSTVSYLDQNGAVLDQVYLAPPPGVSTWGNFKWGAAAWGAGSSGFTQRQCLLDEPIVFKQMSVQLIGACVFGLKVGNMHMRYQPLGYLTDGYL